MTEARFVIEAGRGMQDGALSLNIRDEASGETLARFTLSPEKAWRMIGGGSVHVDGNVSPNLHRIGTDMETRTYTVAASELAHLRDPEARLDQAVEVAKQFQPGWDEYQPRRRNDGDVEVILRRWEASR